MTSAASGREASRGTHAFSRQTPRAFPVSIPRHVFSRTPFPEKNHHIVEKSSEVASFTSGMPPVTPTPAESG